MVLIFRGSTSAIFRVLVVLLMSGSRFWKITLQSNLSDLPVNFRQPRMQESVSYTEGSAALFLPAPCSSFSYHLSLKWRWVVLGLVSG